MIPGKAANLLHLTALRGGATVCAVGCFLRSTTTVDFKEELFGELSRIGANIVTQNVSSGYVQINGGAVNLASQPLWDFGDGTVVRSWFSAAHTYGPPQHNYVVRITGCFTDSATNWM